MLQKRPSLPSVNVKNLTKAAKQASSILHGIDSTLSHVSKNKAFKQSTRDNATSIRRVTQTAIGLTGGSEFKNVKRNIPSHVQHARPHALVVPKSSNPSDDEVMRAIQANWKNSGN